MCQMIQRLPWCLLTDKESSMLKLTSRETRATHWDSSGGSIFNSWLESIRSTRNFFRPCRPLPGSTDMGGIEETQKYNTYTNKHVDALHFRRIKKTGYTKCRLTNLCSCNFVLPQNDSNIVKTFFYNSAKRLKIFARQLKEDLKISIKYKIQKKKKATKKLIICFYFTKNAGPGKSAVVILTHLMT